LNISNKYKNKIFQRLDWLHEKGEVYLASRPTQTQKEQRDKLEQIFEAHCLFKQSAEEELEKARIFLGLGTGIVDEAEQQQQQGGDGQVAATVGGAGQQHLHASDIRQWMATVKQRYDDFSQRMRRYETRLHADLGRPDVCIDCELFFY
jgi:triple functional domain protein